MRFLAVFVLLAIFAISAAGLWWLLPAGPRLTLPVGNQAVFAGFLPDGQAVATLTLPKNGMVFGEICGPVRLWDVKTGHQRRQFADGLKYFDVLFSPDGKLAATVNWVDGQCAIWDTANGQQRFTVATRPQWRQYWNSPPPVAFSADGQSLAVPSPEWDMQLWDLPSGRLRTTVPSVRCFAFAPDGKTIAAAEHFVAGYQVVTLRDVDTGDVRKTLAGPVPSVSSIAFSPDGLHLAAGTFKVFPGGRWGELQPQVQRWLIETGQPEVADHHDRAFSK